MSRAKLSKGAKMLLKDLGYEPLNREMSDNYISEMEDAVTDIVMFEANNLDDGSPDLNMAKLSAAEEILDCIGDGTY